MDDVYVGMPVEGVNGRLGVVDTILRDAVAEPARILVRTDGAEMLTLAPHMYTVDGGVVRVNQGGEQSGVAGGSSFDVGQTQVLATDELSQEHTMTTGGSTGSIAQAPYAMEIGPGEEVRIPVVQEEAIVRTREVEGGGVRVHKTVNEREEVIQQPVYHEQVDVERIAIGRVVDVAPEVREEGDTLIIPVVEEMLVVEKRLVLKEELRITKRRVEETEEARVVLREEQVHVERIGERPASS